MDNTRLTVADKLLLAAWKIEQKGKRPFSAEDLVVSAWELFPDAFSLGGYELPDSNRVFAEIMGSKPLRQQGLIVRAGQKMYRLSEAGIERATALGIRAPLEKRKKVTLARQTLDELKRALACKAVSKFNVGAKDEITFHDACALWRISPRSSAIELAGRINNLQRIIETARAALSGTDAAIDHGGTPVRVADLDLLVQINQHLQERFKKELDVIRTRTDERAHS